jgi:hypothetical protein
MQKKKIDVELTVMGKTCAIQVEKSKREAEHLEDQKITVMHDSLKKYYLIIRNC